MATPNNTVPHQGRVFKNWKTLTFSFFLFILKAMSRRFGGSGEGPQIGDSAGDRTQNLWFHKKIKLELELGILEHMVL